MSLLSESRGHTVFSVVRDGVYEVGNRLLSAAHIAGDAKTILLQPFSLFFTGIDSMTNLRQDVRPFKGQAKSFASGTHQMVHDQCVLLRDTTAGLVGHAVQVINPRVFVNSELMGVNDIPSINNPGRGYSLRAKLHFAEREAAAINYWANWESQKERAHFNYRVVDAVMVFGAEQIVARVCVVAFKVISCGISTVSVVVGAVALPFALVGALFSNGIHFSDYVQHESCAKIPGHRSNYNDERRLPLFTAIASCIAADNIAEAWVLVEEVHNLVLGFLRPVLLVPGRKGALVESSNEEGLSLFRRGIHVVLDIGGNLGGRVSAAGEMFLDGKTLFLQPFAMFFTVFDSLTTVRQSILPKKGRMMVFASGSHIVAKRGFELLRDAFAGLLGHAVRVVNPNAYVDSRLVVDAAISERERVVSEMSVRGRKFSIREIFCTFIEMDISFSSLQESFANWQDRQIHYYSHWGSCEGNRSVCPVGKALMEHVIARVVVIGVRLLGISISAASVVLGAIVLPFALVGVLAKNASDLLIYHRNGWGERSATYVKTVPGDRCYDVWKDERIGNGEELFKEEHSAHRLFEQIVAGAMLFAIDNLSEVFTIALEAHHLVLGLLRPVLLVSNIDLHGR